jgi:Flp pilus assembly protein TadG
MTMAERRAGSKRHGHAQDGAVLVETAIVSLLLLMAIFGILDYGLFLRQVSNVADAVRAGTRAASWSSNGSDADYNILAAMKDSPTGLTGRITRVSVYKADADGHPVNSNCTNFVTVAGACNVYSGSDFTATKAAVIARSSAQNGWDPTTRVPGVDYVGVRIEASHSFVTNFFGVGGPFHDDAVIRIEPVTAASTSQGFSDGVTFAGPPGTLTSKECTSCGNGSGGGGSSG